MTLTDLPKARVAIASAQVRRHHVYLLRMRNRLDRLGILPSDPLYVDVVTAMHAIDGLSVSLH